MNLCNFQALCHTSFDASNVGRTPTFRAASDGVSIVELLDEPYLLAPRIVALTLGMSGLPSMIVSPDDDDDCITVGETASLGSVLGSENDCAMVAVHAETSASLARPNGLRAILFLSTLFMPLPTVVDVLLLTKKNNMKKSSKTPHRCTVSVRTMLSTHGNCLCCCI